jgi:sialic acid synthase SpsE
LHSRCLKDICGMKLNKDVKENDPIDWDLFK